MICTCPTQSVGYSIEAQQDFGSIIVRGVVAIAHEFAYSPEQGPVS
jgi:hypothetical protein